MRKSSGQPENLIEYYSHSFDFYSLPPLLRVFKQMKEGIISAVDISISHIRTKKVLLSHLTSRRKYAYRQLIEVMLHYQVKHSLFASF